jgi:hypothetical protein
MRSFVLGVLTSAAACGALLATALGDDAGTPAQRFRKEMDSVYDYLPFDVTQEVRNAKVAEMDRFWAFVESDLKTYLPLLRDALRDEKSNRYFLYDGSGLLAKHASGPEDWQLAADATARCRMKDVGKGYFWFCHTLAKSSANAVPAILQMLDDPKCGVYVPQHSLTLEQKDCVRLCVLASGEDKWVAPLVARLRAEKDATAVATVTSCLADAVTAEADAAVRGLAENAAADPAARAAARAGVARLAAPAAVSGTAKLTRDEFVAWLAKADAAGRLPMDAMLPAKQLDARLLVDGADVAVLRSLRRKTACRVSDEALGEIDFLTELLRRAAAKAH